jgi:hypothetical protein
MKNIKAYKSFINEQLDDIDDKSIKYEKIKITYIYW